MTTIPSHNIIIQQSGIAHDATHQARSQNPFNPEQLAIPQAIKEIEKKRTVQQSNNSEKIKSDKEKHLQKQEKIKREKKEKRKKEKKQKAKKEQATDAIGSLLNTVV